MTSRAWLRRAGLFAAVLAAVTALLAWLAWRRADPFPLAPIADSPFLNTRPGVAYVGSNACVACHQDQHASFRQTGMGSSMAEVDATAAPPDGGFDHPVSKRRYQVYRKDGKLWHRELLLAGAATDVVLAEYPVKYVVGSGRHALTYLVEADGFLVESPVSWFAQRRAWDVSPGYDHEKQQGFTRPIGEGCLYCHASQATTIGPTTHRVHIGEVAIGCERCHGPGSLHVERHEGLAGRGSEPPGDVDYTIVNPAHLTRDLAEAVCQQCHLNSDATAILRGRKQSDFRPGLRLQDFRQVYVFDGTSRSMTVVGHVEQMHLSRCYQASSTFSCLTCHDPHGEPAAADRVNHYRAACLTCHRLDSCTVAADHRKRESPGNDCVHCHMPQAPTDIAHLAFTHHRVGIHRKAAGADVDASDADELRPFLPFPELNALDQKLALGQAYRALAIRGKDPQRRPEWGKRALALLSAVHEAGLRDADLEAGLAQLTADMKVGDPLAHAQSALTCPTLAGQSRCDALFVRAQMQAGQGQYTAAAADMRELTQLRRHAFDWLFLANFERALGDEAAARAALHGAVRINPRQWDVHRHLAEYYRQQGDAERAAWHEERAVR